MRLRGGVGQLCDSYTCPGYRFLTINIYGQRQGLQDTFRRVVNKMGVIEVGQEDSKLVAAKPCHSVKLSSLQLDTLGNLAQQGIAHRMAE